MTQAQTISFYQPTLQAIAIKILRSKADAEDIVQETFLKWLSIEQEKILNTKAYLIKSVTNNCLTYLNAIKSKRWESLDSFHWPEFMEKFKETTDFSYLDIETELSKALHILQNKLEPLERAVYVLKEVFDFDYKSLQVLLNKKQDHCRQVFCRAKKKLKYETDQFNAIIQPKKTALLDSFRKACEFGHAFELAARLQEN